MFLSSKINTCIIGFLICCILPSNVYSKSISEYHAKALFLFNIIDFVKWPQNHNGELNIIKICVLGKNPFEDYLNDIARSRNKSIDVNLHYTRDLKTISDCNILYIDQSETYNLTNILNTIKNMPILSISDINKFAYKEGMIELGIHYRKSKILFKLNLQTLDKSNIKLSSNLIELASVIYGYNKGADK